MSIELWWPKLRPETRAWLIDTNGDVVDPAIADEIRQLGGTPTKDEWWVGESGASGFYFSDAAVDWIEAVANGETPAPTNRRCSACLEAVANGETLPAHQ